MNEPALNYSVCLLYPEEPSLETLDKFLELRFSHVTAIDAAGGGHRGFAFPELAGHCGLPPQVHVTPMASLPTEAELAGLLAHTRNWDGAAEASRSAAFGLRVTDMFAQTLSPGARLLWFRQVVAAVHEASFASAILWTPSQCVVNPEKLLDTVPMGLASTPLYGAVNVRAFQVEGSPAGEVLMDTVGLASLGLVDLECQFSGIDKSVMAEALFASAFDVVQQTLGPNSDRLNRVGEGQGWRCQERGARVEPARRVLAIVPGATSLD